MKDRRKKHIIIASVIALVLLGIGLTVFFLVPREPSVDFGDPTYSNLINSDTQFSINVEIPFTVDNPNYYDIKMKKLDLDIYYRDVFVVNLVEEKDYKFKKRGVTDSIIETVISTTDTSILPLIKSDLDSGTPLRMKFSGNAKLSALSISINHKISFTKDISITS